MKISTFSLLGALLFMLVACSEPKTAADQLVPDTPNSGPVAPPTTPSASTVVPGASGQIAHYICPNNCANSGAAQAGNCAVCGTQLLHNQAFHDAANTAASPTITTTPQAPQQPAPAQNAAGVYHYTCNNGCAGGSGTAGNCAVCGNPLAHNAAYHN